MDGWDESADLYSVYIRRFSFVIITPSPSSIYAPILCQLFIMSYWGTVMDSGNTQQYGRRLVPVIVDEIAAKDPGRICFSFPRSLNLKDGFYDLTFRTVSF